MLVLRVILFSMLLVSSTYGQMKVVGDKNYKPYEKIVLRATETSSKNAQFLWDVEGKAEYVESGDTLYVWAAPGNYKVKLISIDFDKKKIDRANFGFTVGGDPGPGPGPGPKITSITPASGSVGTEVRVAGLEFGNVSAVTLNGKAVDFKLVANRYSELTFVVPVGATSGKVRITNQIGVGESDFTVVDVGPPPIPGEGMRVLIVYESAELTKYPQRQQAIISGAPFRRFLDSVCVIGPDGKSPERRIYDKDTDVSAESKTWQIAMANAKRATGFKTPWILVSNGKTGYSGPLPATVEEATDLINKYTKAGVRHNELILRIDEIVRSVK